MDDLMEKLVALCKRRGFIFQSSEIYGGIGGFWDYGPLGVELKRNVKEAWWQEFVTAHDELATPESAPGPYQMVGLDCSIIMNPKVWEASGHVKGFADPMVDCRETKRRYRFDQIRGRWLHFTPGSGEVPTSLSDDKKKQYDEQQLFFIVAESDLSEPNIDYTVEQACRVFGVRSKHADKAFRWVTDELVSLSDEEDLELSAVVAPGASEPGTLTHPRLFNLMFETHIGAVQDEENKAYLRPETAQGIFTNFKNVLDTARVKLPFGIAQVGKAFRNEINPRNYTFRSREFEQMEIEFFCRPEEAPDWYTYWRDRRLAWYVALGLESDRLKLRDHAPDELAHYAAACADVEYDFPFGTAELEGIANRTDFDLKAHAEHSGKDLSYFDEDTKARIMPYVIEPSAGVDRSVLAFLCEAYTEDEVPDEKGNPQKRTVMKLHPRLAPVKAAVFPLVKRDGMPEIAADIYRDLKRAGFAVFYDEKGAIGRRYRRQDETGTPFCITVDSQTLADQTVTFRDRDTCRQWRVPLTHCAAELRTRLHP